MRTGAAFAVPVAFGERLKVMAHETTFDTARMITLAGRLADNPKLSETFQYVYFLVKILLIDRLNKGMTEITLTQWDGLCQAEHDRQVSVASAA